MAVLLTGGAGYVGSHTCVSLLEQGYDIVVVDNYVNASPVSLQRVESITGKRFKQYNADLRDREAMKQIFAENKIDSVIHFAALKAVAESVHKPLEYYDNNLYSAIVLLETMRDFGVNKFIYSSSATVYGVSPNMPLTEDTPTGCINPYGWTKYMVEQILRDAAVADNRLSVVMLRYFNPVGAHESGLIGDDPEGLPNNLLPYISRVAIGALPKLHVFGNDYNTPDGTCLRDYIHVMDLAEGHIAAMNYCDGHVGCEAINLGTGQAYSVLEMVHTFERVNEVPVPYEITQRRAGDVDASWSSTEKAERLLGWKARRGLDEMLKDTWRWQSMNPHGYRGA